NYGPYSLALIDFRPLIFIRHKWVTAVFVLCSLIEVATRGQCRVITHNVNRDKFSGDRRNDQFDGREDKATCAAPLHFAPCPLAPPGAFHKPYPRRRAILPEVRPQSCCPKNRYLHHPPDRLRGPRDLLRRRVCH